MSQTYLTNKFTILNGSTEPIKHAIYKTNFTIQNGDVPLVQRPKQEEIMCLARSIRDVSQSGRRSIYMAGDDTLPPPLLRHNHCEKSKTLPTKLN